MRHSKKIGWGDVKLGIFVFSGIAIMIFMVLIVGTNILAFSTTYTLKTIVPNVVGVNEGAFITIAGIKAGTIGDFEVGEDGDEYVITMSLFIDTEFKPKITASSRASIRTLGMLGDKYVEISLGKADEAPLESGDMVEAVVPVDFEKMGTKVESALNTLPDVLKSTEELLQEIKNAEGLFSSLLHNKQFADEMAQISKNLVKLTSAMNNKKGTVGRLMHEDEPYNELLASTRSLKSILLDVQKGRGTVGRLIADSSLYRNLESISLRADSVAAKLNNGTGTAGKLISNSDAHDRLESLLHELETLLQDIKKYPQKYFNVKVF